ncbi:MAG: hypothetical protein Q9164_001903 [Protoblastenia rupestris]
MSFFKRVPVIAPFLAGLLYPHLVSPSPLEPKLNPHESRVDVIKSSTVDLLKRQDEDIDPEADKGTGPLRSATWYQVATAANDSSPSFTPYTETTKDANDSPKDPSDKNQYSSRNKWNVDHILELQVIARAFDSSRPSNIPQEDWSKASSAVFTKGAENTAIAKAVTNLKNLQGIPDSLNTFKKQVFTGNLTGKGFPSTGNDATFFSFFGPAVQKYLIDHKDDLMSGTNSNIGDEVKRIGNNNQKVKDHYTSFASRHYQGCIDYLSTWSGKNVDRHSTSATPTSTSASPTSTASAGGAEVTCHHAAAPGPGEPCEAIRNSETVGVIAETVRSMP